MMESYVTIIAINSIISELSVFISVAMHPHMVHFKNDLTVCMHRSALKKGYSDFRTSFHWQQAMHPERRNHLRVDKPHTREMRQSLAKVNDEPIQW